MNPSPIFKRHRRIWLFWGTTNSHMFWIADVLSFIIYELVKVCDRTWFVLYRNLGMVNVFSFLHFCSKHFEYLRGDICLQVEWNLNFWTLRIYNSSDTKLFSTPVCFTSPRTIKQTMECPWPKISRHAWTREWHLPHALDKILIWAHFLEPSRFKRQFYIGFRPLVAKWNSWHPWFQITYAGLGPACVWLVSG